MRFIKKSAVPIIGLFLTSFLLYKYFKKRPLYDSNNPFVIVLGAFISILILLIIAYFKNNYKNNKE